MVKDDRGFTMVEMLVVLVVMAVLASIAIAQFLDARAKAQDREAMAAARNTHVALQLHHHQHGDYAATNADLEGIEKTMRSALDLRLTTTRRTFALSVASRSKDRGGGRFAIAQDADGVVTRSCEHPGRGGCNADGGW